MKKNTKKLEIDAYSLSPVFPAHLILILNTEII